MAGLCRLLEPDYRATAVGGSFPAALLFTYHDVTNIQKENIITLIPPPILWIWSRQEGVRP